MDGRKRVSLNFVLGVCTAVLTGVLVGLLVTSLALMLVGMWLKR